MSIYHKVTTVDKKELIIRVPPRNKYSKTTYIHPYTSTNVPFAYGIKKNLPTPDNFPINIIFKGDLRNEQVIVSNKCIDRLNDKQSILLASHVGFGKTVVAIYLICKVQLKTLILTHRKTLKNQWKQALDIFTEGSKIQNLEPNEEPNPNNDIFILNPINITKIKSDLSFIGMVIVDEAHLLLSNVFSKALLAVTPTYLIGLSATPYRTDSLNGLFIHFFGEAMTEFGKYYESIYIIYKPLHREHTVFYIYTGFEPSNVLLTKDGTLDWGNILNEQARSEKRNDMIIDLLLKFPSRMLILCRRIAQIKILYDKCVERGISVEAALSNEEITQTKRVLIGTTQKLGTGFDPKNVHSLILAADIEEYFVQYQGRVFRNPDITPTIFDLVDSFGPLYKHFETRKKQYINSGGTLIRLDNELNQI